MGRTYQTEKRSKKIPQLIEPFDGLAHYTHGSTMSGSTFQPPEDDFNSPDGLTADLSRLYRRPVAVPPAVDEAILAHAVRQAAKVRRMRVLLRWGGGIAAAAAMILVAIRLLPSHPPAFNASGRVTILDAFTLARQLQNGAKPDKSWDVNGDGVIDQKDVDALAAKAVQLPKGGVQ